MTARWHVEPIGMDDAARAIGVCRRLLSDILARHPHYETRAAPFTQAEIARA